MNNDRSFGGAKAPTRLATKRGLANCLGLGLLSSLLFAGSAQAQTQTWTKIADEWQDFSVTGTQTVRFGVGTLWLQRSITGTVQCNRVVFGSDPAPGQTKECDVLSVVAAALPAPPVSPLPVVNYEYDAQGNPTRTVQAPGVSGFNFSTSTSYDSLDRRQTLTNARNGTTQLGYDGRENLTQVTDPRSLVTQSPRNGLGDITQLISPDTGTASSTYDAAGNIKTRTDSRGVLACYGCDALNRLTILSTACLR